MVLAFVAARADGARAARSAGGAQQTVTERRRSAADRYAAGRACAGVTPPLRARRAGLVDGVLERLRGGGAAEALAEGFARHRGKVAVGVDWARFELPWLQRVARALGGEVVAAAVNAYASDYATFSHGAPGLLLLATDGRRARLVEVKGPNDRLSDSQVAWIDVLVRAGAEVEVCRVERA